jgi:hypothetical protein
MNANRILVGEFIAALGFVAWGAIKNQYWPWPSAIVKLGASFGIFGVIAMAAPEFAAAATGGVLLALFVKEYSAGIEQYAGGVPNFDISFPYTPLGWGPNAN